MAEALPLPNVLWTPPLYLQECPNLELATLWPEMRVDELKGSWFLAHSLLSGSVTDLWPVMFFFLCMFQEAALGPYCREMWGINRKLIPQRVKDAFDERYTSILSRRNPVTLI